MTDPVREQDILPLIQIVGKNRPAGPDYHPLTQEEVAKLLNFCAAQSEPSPRTNQVFCQLTLAIPGSWMPHRTDEEDPEFNRRYADLTRLFGIYDSSTAMFDQIMELLS